MLFFCFGHMIWPSIPSQISLWDQWLSFQSPDHLILLFTLVPFPCPKVKYKSRHWEQNMECSVKWEFSSTGKDQSLWCQVYYRDMLPATKWILDCRRLMYSVSSEHCRLLFGRRDTPDSARESAHSSVLRDLSWWYSGTYIWCWRWSQGGQFARQIVLSPILALQFWV